MKRVWSVSRVEIARPPIERAAKAVFLDVQLHFRRCSETTCHPSSGRFTFHPFQRCTFFTSI